MAFLGRRVGVVIPALDEEAAIGSVLAAIPDWVDQIVVADNGSCDRTHEIASSLGATVVIEPERGYGGACLRGIAALRNIDTVVFIDADNSDYPEDMGELVEPIASGTAHLTIGTRTLRKPSLRALSVQQRFGNWLATLLIQRIWRHSYTDLGPYRAISHDALQKIAMTDRKYGWTVQMQIRAIEHGLDIIEVPVRYRRRIGRSKISGTVGGVLRAGHGILGVIFHSALARRRFRSADRGTPSPPA